MPMEDLRHATKGRPMSENNAVTASSWVDPDDAPEWTDAMFDRAELRLGETVLRRGRPPGETKTQVSLRIDNDVLARFRADGPGWQTRMNDALRWLATRARM